MAEPWLTDQLAQFLGVFKPGAEATAHVEALAHIAEAFAADVVALVNGDVVENVVGLSPGSNLDGVLAAAHGSIDRLEIPGVGACSTTRVPTDDGGAWLVIARQGVPLDEAERTLAWAMGRALAITVRLINAVDAERSARAEADSEARKGEELLRRLQERQRLGERLYSIQRMIVQRTTTSAILDAITVGLTDAVHCDEAGIRLIDDDDPTRCRIVTAVGISEDIVEATRIAPIERSGIGGLAIARDTLVVSADYASDPAHLPAYVAAGLQAVMAAPIHRDGVAVGSLLVATREPKRTFNELDKEALLAYAEHASLALNDASAMVTITRALETAVHRALHDPLTELPNRASAMHRIGEALRGARESDSPLALLFVDLDRFKAVNDLLGHAAGDDVLRIISARARRELRDTDLIARLAGDEFIILVPDLPEEKAFALAHRIASKLGDPIELRGRQLTVTASIGVAMATAADDPDTLLSNADQAMYRAKQLGRARVKLFDEALRERFNERVEIERQLIDALVNDELRVVYQPYVTLADGRIAGAEALVRWQHPERGLLTPASFLDSAEESGLVQGVDGWMLHQACAQLSDWSARGAPFDRLIVAVNLSAQHFSEAGVSDLVLSTLAEHLVDPRRLAIEITETAMFVDTASASEEVDRLRARGVRVVLDDFGTGFSSLTYLKNFGLDALKIDRSFVDGLGSDRDDDAIVTAILSLARAFSISVVAEGVETERQVAELRRLGCSHAQGYFFGHPQSAEALEELIAAATIAARAS